MKLPTPIHWKNLFALWSLQGIASLIWLLSIPTDTSNPVAFGFSAARLALLGAALFLTIFSLLLWLQPRIFSQRTTSWIQQHEATVHDALYIAGLFVVVSVGLVFYAFSLLPESAAYVSILQRLRPMLVWFGLSSLELAIVIAWNRYEQAKDTIGNARSTFRKTILLMAIWGFAALLIVTTQIGITPVENFGGPPVSFLEWQIVLVILIVGLFVFIPVLNSQSSLSKWIPLGIYIFTVVLWLSQPINTAYFATPPRAPAFEIYPFSDAQFYAQYAQSALVGEGFLWPEVPARPFYVAILTWLHLLGNQSYNNVVVLQTLILALFPVSLFILGKKIGGRPLGLSLALLTAFRDINSNVSAPFANNVTYSKLFFSELPAALLISLATLLAFRWRRQSDQPNGVTLLLGGVLGAVSLIRLQSAVLVVVILLFAWIAIPDRKQFFKGALFVIVGFVLVITPWFLRNYLATGGLVLDNPISQTMTMTRRWSGSEGNELIDQLPGESDAQYSSRLMGMAIDSFKSNPGFILRTAANHFVNNEIASLLAFPLRDQLLSPAELVWPQHSFWITPITASQIPLFAFYLFLFTLGLVFACQRHGAWGALPLGMGLAYNFSSAVFFSSGVRFLVPLDWSVQLYQIFGLLILGGWLLAFTETARTRISAWLAHTDTADTVLPAAPVNAKRGFTLSFLTVLFLAAFLPLTENMFPQRYPLRSQREITQEIGVMPGPGEIVIYGRAVYPRYYESGDGEPDTAKLGYGASEQARLVFFLIGPEKNQLVIFNLESVPDFFPNTSDVFMIGTQMDTHFSPRIVVVTKNGQSARYTNE